MNCCTTASTEGTNKFFSRHSKRYLKEFRKKGLGKEQRLLLEGISTAGFSNKTILDIGCGVGALHLTMLQQGAASSTGIDISEGMLNNARNLAHDLHLEDKAQYIMGDIVQANGKIQNADIVILDKVVCCYENIKALLQHSTSKSSEIYAFTYPNPNPLVALSFKGLILLGTVFRWKFRPYWHNWNNVCESVAEKGFKEIYAQHTFFWNVKVFQRG